jgi:hypothetical protein
VAYAIVLVNLVPVGGTDGQLALIAHLGHPAWPGDSAPPLGLAAITPRPRLVPAPVLSTPEPLPQPTRPS